MWIEQQVLSGANPELRAEVTLQWLERIAEVYADPEAADKAAKVTYQDHFFQTAFKYLFDRTTGKTSVKGIELPDGSRKPFSDVIDVFLSHHIVCGPEHCAKRMRDWIKMLTKQVSEGKDLWEK
jgi:hypothetical protein